ncbi:IS200/IS605 family transposase [Cesiribacter sp. SM1]|uniref:IS200/IS605 family transposase n=1 Tax=Cesiribacter sp. SM1 TaxID=2861196 RepID=UPI001CD281F0|nr:IS200/IS605 family transposase [Cesiribacter sp. SM1]
MAGTYSQIYIQVVFAVKGRESLIRKEWKEDLHRYIAGIIKQKGQKPIIVNGMQDHVHVFLGLRPSMAISDLVREIKNNSSNFINSQKLVKGKFYWQEGYGAFSYAHSQIDQVYQYILNQEQHHKKRSFREEYCELLKRFEIEHEDRFLFDWLE